jgi:hypothetical protein
LFPGKGHHSGGSGAGKVERLTSHEKADSGVAEIPSGGRLSRTGLLLLAGVLLLVTIVVLHGISRGEFHLNVDEAHHAVTGLYIADLIRDFPLTHPIQYTYQYYARYPAVGVFHWPPFFHFVEGLAFLVFGPSVLVARLTVLAFTLLGICFWFKLVSELQNERAAAVSSLLLAFLPSILLYEKAVMLEVPSLALCIAATYFWTRYLREGTTQCLYWFALFACLAMLTKQQSAYLGLFCLLTILAERKWRLLFNWSFVRTFVVCLLLVGPFYILAFSVYSKEIAIAVFKRSAPAATPLTYYWRILPGQLGIPLLVLSVLSIVTCWWWGKRQSELVMLMWIAACFLLSSAIAGKEPRYILYWLPPFTYFAVSPLLGKSWTIRWRLIAVPIVAALLLTQSWSAWAYQRPYLSGYAALARRLVQNDAGGIVLFDGNLSANFIFHLRASDPGRHWLVMRKALYIVLEGKEFGGRELITNRDELQELIRNYGLKYFVVEERGPFDFDIQRILREELQSPQFTLLDAIPIESNVPTWQGQRLLLYKNNHPTQRTMKDLRLEMMGMGKVIVVSLDDLRIP